MNNNYNNNNNNNNTKTSKGLQYELDKMQQLGTKLYIITRYRNLDYRLKLILDKLNGTDQNQKQFKQNDNWDDNDFGIKEF